MKTIPPGTWLFLLKCFVTVESGHSITDHKHASSWRTYLFRLLYGFLSNVFGDFSSRFIPLSPRVVILDDLVSQVLILILFGVIESGYNITGNEQNSFWAQISYVLGIDHFCLSK